MRLPPRDLAVRGISPPRCARPNCRQAPAGRSGCPPAKGSDAERPSLATSLKLTGGHSWAVPLLRSSLNLPRGPRCSRCLSTQGWMQNAPLKSCEKYFASRLFSQSHPWLPAPGLKGSASRRKAIGTRERWSPWGVVGLSPYIATCL